jgi:hypothetical protein
MANSNSPNNLYPIATAQFTHQEQTSGGGHHHQHSSSSSTSSPTAAAGGISRRKSRQHHDMQLNTLVSFSEEKFEVILMK